MGEKYDRRTTDFLHTQLGEGRATLAFNLLDPKRVFVSVAFCAPGDRFCRATGRNKASGRFNSTNGGYLFNFERNPNMKYKQQAYNLFLNGCMYGFLGSKAVPRWASKAAKDLFFKQMEPVVPSEPLSVEEGYETVIEIVAGVETKPAMIDIPEDYQK